MQSEKDASAEAPIDTATVSLDGTWMIAVDPDNTGKQEKWFEGGPRADAVDGAGALGHFIFDVACGKHRPLLIGPLFSFEALGQFSLAFSEDSVILILHSKSPFSPGACFCTDAL